MESSKQTTSAMDSVKKSLTPVPEATQGVDSPATEISATRSAKSDTSGQPNLPLKSKTNLANPYGGPFVHCIPTGLKEPREASKDRRGAISYESRSRSPSPRRPLSDDDVSPKTKSNKPIRETPPQSCGRCGEPGWSTGYCPKCGSGNAFGTT